MNIKRIGLLAIIAMSPFVANATTPHIGPAGNFDDDVTGVELATDDPFYRKTEISNADAEHIATTAYVKGAYNDTIAAINQTALSIYASRQPTLQKISSQGGEAPLELNYVVDKQLFMEDYVTNTNDAINGFMWNNSLVTAAAVAKLVNTQRVEVYTNFDDDTAKKQISFVTASGQN